MQTVEQKISDSAEAFRDRLWPLIAGHLGGGRIVAVESVVDQDFFRQYLDAYGGIDSWHISDEKCLMRGIASRMQRTRMLFHSVTIRYRRTTGNKTEIHKRMNALRQPGGWLHPQVVIQGYFHPTDTGYGEPRAVAIANMADIIRVICDGKQGTSWRDPQDWYVDSTSAKYGNYDNTEFAVVPIETLKRLNIKHRWILFDSSRKFSASGKQPQLAVSGNSVCTPGDRRVERRNG